MAEGRNLAIEYKWSEGKPDRMHVPELKVIRSYGVLAPAGTHARRSLSLIDRNRVVRGKWIIPNPRSIDPAAGAPAADRVIE